MGLNVYQVLKAHFYELSIGSCFRRKKKGKKDKIPRLVVHTDINNELDNEGPGATMLFQHRAGSYQLTYYSVNASIIRTR